MDFTITMLSAIPEVMELVGSASASNALLSVTRELRTIRVLRALKVIVRFGSLKIIVLTIMQAFESMAFIMLLVLIFMYIFAIIAINLFESYVRSPIPDLKYQYAWQNVGTALQMLFQLLTLDQWDAVNIDMDRAADPMLTTVFIFLWVCLGSFIFRNVFVGVMVNNFAKISETLKEKKAEYFKKRKFLRMRKKLNKELKVQGNIQRSIVTEASGLPQPTTFDDRVDSALPAPSEAVATNGAPSEPDAPRMNQLDANSQERDSTQPALPDDGRGRPNLVSQPPDSPSNRKVSDTAEVPERNNSETPLKPETRNDGDILETIQRLLIASHGISKGKFHSAAA
ncbi:hypothetical protein HDU93_001524 [Gonapodya sp. JEL0774]|nr:hypothetical protein HDU93_001524 [Gonapodya sp. JEL0774]